MVKNSKKIFNDIVINLFATVAPVLILQFGLFPIIATKYNSQHYGVMLTIIGLITLSTQAFSVSLGNSRMLLDNEYDKLNIKGDFNVLLIASSFLNIILILLGTFYYGNFNFINVFLIVIIAIVQLIRKYFLVYFRIKINYKNVLYSNVFLTIGYFIGLIVFLLSENWQSILFIGELLSLLYVIKHTNFYKEPLRITPYFKRTTKHSLILFIASLLGTANTYLDRLFLFPLLGPKAVAVYYVSSLFGKTLALGIAPLSNVILSYLIRLKQLNVKSFLLTVFLSLIIGAISYIIILLLCKPILSFMYPSYIESALNIINITTITAIVTMMTGLINPMVMRYKNINWQVWINLLNIIVFLSLSTVFIHHSGLMGFCYAALISSVIKWVFTIVIFISQKSVN